MLGTFRDKRGGLDRHARSSAQADSEDEDDAGGSGDTAEDKKLAGWVYVGSHNFTPSAWGTLSGSGFNPTLNVSLNNPSSSLNLAREADNAADYQL